MSMMTLNGPARLLVLALGSAILLAGAAGLIWVADIGVIEHLPTLD